MSIRALVYFTHEPDIKSDGNLPCVPHKGDYIKVGNAAHLIRHVVYMEKNSAVVNLIVEKDGKGLNEIT